MGVYFKNFNQDLGIAEYIISTGHLTPRASPTNLSYKAFCAFTNYEDFANRECTITNRPNAPRVTQSWISCNSNFHSRGCDLYVNTTILKTHMDMLLSSSLCRTDSIEQADALGQFDEVVGGGGGVSKDASSVAAAPVTVSPSASLLNMTAAATRTTGATTAIPSSPTPGVIS